VNHDRKKFYKMGPDLVADVLKILLTSGAAVVGVVVVVVKLAYVLTRSCVSRPRKLPPGRPPSWRQRHEIILAPSPTLS
jgi:hypothetical protein